MEVTVNASEVLTDIDTPQDYQKAVDMAADRRKRTGKFMDDIYEAITRLRRRGEKAVLATIVNTRGSAPRKESAKMLVTNDGKIKGTIGAARSNHHAYRKL